MHDGPVVLCGRLYRELRDGTDGMQWSLRRHAIRSDELRRVRSAVRSRRASDVLLLDDGVWAPVFLRVRGLQRFDFRRV